MANVANGAGMYYVMWWNSEQWMGRIVWVWCKGRRTTFHRLRHGIQFSILDTYESPKGHTERPKPCIRPLPCSPQTHNNRTLNESRKKRTHTHESWREGKREKRIKTISEKCGSSIAGRLFYFSLSSCAVNWRSLWAVTSINYEQNVCMHEHISLDLASIAQLNGVTRFFCRSPCRCRSTFFLCDSTQFSYLFKLNFHAVRYRPMNRVETELSVN